MHPVFATNRVDLIIFQTAVIIWAMPELISSIVQNKIVGARTPDRGSRLVLGLGMYAGIFFGVQTAFLVPQLAIGANRTLLFGIGIAMMLAGIAFRWYSISVLGKFFTRTVTIQPEQPVIERGPYRYIRHPSYTGAMLTFIGFGLTLTNWLSLGLVLSGLVIGYGYRVLVEERVLREGLGQPYEAYMLRTKRFIPFLF